MLGVYMKQLIGTKFLLNGIMERVLQVPETRDGNVAVTMGGLANNRTEISLVEFERTTGYCLKDLDPAPFRSNAEVIDDYLHRLREMDMTISKNPNATYLITSNIEFTTKSNSKMKASLNAIHREQGGYLVSVRKINQYAAQQTQTITGTNLEILLETAIDLLRTYISTKVQVTSKAIDPGDRERKFDESGIPHLFVNESIESYFKAQSKPAGVAINNKGRFQVFTSYENANGDRLFHYQTKDYASLKNAEKALEALGYSVDGKFLDVTTSEQLREFESDSRKFMRTETPHWRPGTSMAEFNVSHGVFVISEIYKEEDPDHGVVLCYSASYQNDANGKRIDRKNKINVVDGNPFSFSDKIHGFMREVNAGIEGGNLAYDQDIRTLDEIISHHKDRFNEHTKRFKTLNSNYNNLLESNSSPGQWQENYKNLMDQASQKIGFHKDALERLGKEVDKLERSHEFSKGEPSL